MKLIQGTGLALAALSTVASAGVDCSTLPATVVNVSSDISVATTWTADNQYNLTTQIFVLPGASLTIEAGTVIASAATVNGAGSLAVTRGAQIFVQGTADCPVIMTSTNDTATWVGGDPKTGTWREAASEWGNLTVMGSDFISENATTGNTSTCGNNTALMEGLIDDGSGRNVYGGTDANDDSGSIEYLSLRYGGRVIGLADELNGLSLGGIGSGTTINHIEVMNNVDDGIEIWGGSVDIDHFSIWNIGDDSLDLDQGYRGRMQFGLIVQGYSQPANQGSGVGDNAIEMDGAEAPDWQPVTTSVAYNLTVIGQPFDGDFLTDYKDNCRMQFRNAIFMDGGDDVIHDGGGYGPVLDFASTFSTDWNSVPPSANDCPPGFYTAQFSGKLSEISDSVLFNNADYGTFNAVNMGGNNVVEPASSPITAITRATPTLVGPQNKIMARVLTLDPRPAGDAVTSFASAPANGFFVPASYRGAFEPNTVNTWLGRWTSSFAFGFTADSGANTGTAYCFGDGTGSTCPCSANGNAGEGCLNTTGTNGATLVGTGNASISNDTFGFQVSGVPGSKPGLILRGINQIAGGSGNPAGDGLLCAGGQSARSRVQVTSGGSTTYTEFDTGLSFGGASYGAGVTANYQFWYRDPSNTCSGAGFNFTNGWTVTWGN